MANDKERDPGSSSAEIGKYLDILAKDPKSRVFAPLAEAYRKAGFLDDAVATALEGLRVHPNYLGGRVALGRAYFEKKQYVEAAIEMEKVAKSAPDNIIAHRVLGQIADSRNDLPAAEKAFRMVMLLDPRDLEAQQFLKSLKGAATAPPPPPPPPPPAPAPAPAPPPIDEMGIEDLELPAEETVGEPWALPPPAPPWPSAPAPVPPPPPPQPAPPRPSAPASLAMRLPAQPPPPSPAAPPWPSAPAPLAPAPALAPIPSAMPPPAPPRPPAPPQPAPPREASPPPPSPPSDEDADSQSLFEQFSREPGPRAAPATARVERGVEMGPRVLDLETTAYNPSDEYDLDEIAAPAAAPGEELQLITPAEETHLDIFAPEHEAFVEEHDLELDQEPELEPVQEHYPVGTPDLDLELEIAPAQEQPLETKWEPAPPPEQPPEAEPEEEQYEEPEEEPPAAAGRGVFDTETLAAIYVKQGFYGRAAEIYRRLIEQSPDDTGLRGKLEGVLALERRAAGIEEVAAAVEEPVAPAEERITIDEEPVETAEKPITIDEEPVEPAVAPIAIFEEPVETTEKPIAIFEEPVETAAEPIAIFGEPAAPAEEPIGIFDEPAAAVAAPPAPVRPDHELTIRRLETLLETFKGGRPR